MRILIISLMAMFPSLALAVPLTFNFSGTTGVGSVNGSFTYETVQTPLATNVRGLLDNATYQLSTWQFLAESNMEEFFPATTYSSATGGGTAEFCQGKCIFGSGPVWYTTLTFANGTTSLRLAFNLADPSPLTSAPSGPNEWGSFVTQSTFRGTTGGLALFSDGTLSSTSVPEPSSILLSIFAIPFLRHRAMP